MTSKRVLQVVSVTAVAFFSMAAAGRAATLTYSTNAPGSEFVSPSTGLSVNSSSGLSATLTFQADANVVSGTPSNINYGIFTLSCTACLTDHSDSATFNAFTFNLIITDQTDGATGEFVGTSPGGSVEFNASTLTIDWSSLQLGPDTSGALSGNFATTVFAITPSTEIVAPNSGTNVGQTTVQGGLDFNSVPEPGTVSLVGVGLLGLGWNRRRALKR